MEFPGCFLLYSPQEKPPPSPQWQFALSAAQSHIEPAPRAVFGAVRTKLKAAPFRDCARLRPNIPAGCFAIFSTIRIARESGRNS
jgi:hypothetical protein